MKELGKGTNLSRAALKAAMDPKTARKYRDKGFSNDEAPKARSWRTRRNPFLAHWDEIELLLSNNPGILGKTIFEYLCRRYPNSYQSGQLRTLQRLIKKWRALKGPAKTVMFSQIHRPGELSASDFTCMNSLGITINGQPFAHLFYHFVLTYSNWESATLCFSESFESLSAGLQNAFMSLGGVTDLHRTDNLAAAYKTAEKGKTLTDDFQALLSHYNVKGHKINPGCSNENGDVESSNKYFKKAVEQEIMLRGSSDFSTREQYIKFVREIVSRRNKCINERFKAELPKLKALPERRLIEGREFKAKVSASSTIRILKNTYSVHSRLIGETVKVLCYCEYFEIYCGNNRVDVLPRLRGNKKKHIQYRHVIDSLCRKPGAFHSYRYRDELFPSSHFRITYDELCQTNMSTAAKNYLKILQLAAKKNEAKVGQQVATPT